MAEIPPNDSSSMTVGSNEPLVGVIVRRNGTELVHYTTDERALDQLSGQQSMQRALDLAGAWSDLNWDEMEQALDRIRHESRPTPPIDDL
jgi:hypothetical protein